MKVKNIAFSGVMATILLGAGAASAETTAKIASQKYVDDKATQTLSTVSNTYATQQSVTDVSNQVTNISNALNDEETGLRAQITAVKTTADKNKDDISAMDSRVAKNTDDIKELNDNLDKSIADSIAAALSGEGEGGDIKKAIDNAIDAAVDDLTADVSGLKTTVGDENSGLVKRVGANEAAIEKLNGDADTTGSVANTVKELAIPKPDDSCSADSGRCVLSVDKSGNLMWLDVTAPLGESN